jgi:hypothetical protein
MKKQHESVTAENLIVEETRRMLITPGGDITISNESNKYGIAPANSKP